MPLYKTLQILCLRSVMVTILNPCTPNNLTNTIQQSILQLLNHNNHELAYAITENLYSARIHTSQTQTQIIRIYIF